MVLQPVTAQRAALVKGVAELLHLVRVGVRARARVSVRVRVRVEVEVVARIWVRVRVRVRLRLRDRVRLRVRLRRRVPRRGGWGGGLCTWFSLQPRIQTTPLRSNATYRG